MSTKYIELSDYNDYTRNETDMFIYHSHKIK